MFQRLLICTDFQDGLQRLVGLVPSLATGGVQQVTFFHHVPLNEEGEIPRVDADRVEAARTQLRQEYTETAGVSVQFEIESGRLVDKLLKVAREHQADGILLGPDTKDRLTEQLFGSTTRELTQKTPIPLMVLRPPMLLSFTREELALRCQHLCHTLMIPFDGSEAARYTLEFVQSHIHTGSIQAIERCILCWVSPEAGYASPSLAEQQQTAHTLLNPLKAQLEAAGIETTIVLRQGNRVSEILAAAASYDISAIVMASDRLGKLLEWSVPSVTGELLRRSWYPVVFLPHR